MRSYCRVCGERFLAKRGSKAPRHSLFFMEQCAGSGQPTISWLAQHWLKIAFLAIVAAIALLAAIKLADSPAAKGPVFGPQQPAPVSSPAPTPDPTPATTPAPMKAPASSSAELSDDS